jgi:hypothetical protein
LPISRHVNFDFGNSSKNPDDEDEGNFTDEED